MAQQPPHSLQKLAHPAATTSDQSAGLELSQDGGSMFCALGIVLVGTEGQAGAGDVMASSKEVGESALSAARTGTALKARRVRTAMSIFIQ
jgi:hypothetical protein